MCSQWLNPSLQIFLPPYGLFRSWVVYLHHQIPLLPRRNTVRLFLYPFYDFSSDRKLTPVIAYQLDILLPKLIFVHHSLVKIAIAALDTVESARMPLKNIVILGSAKGSQSLTGFTTFDDLVSYGRGQRSIEWRKFRAGEARTAPAFLCWSSGTTGNPKVRVDLSFWFFWHIKFSGCRDHSLQRDDTNSHVQQSLAASRVTSRRKASKAWRCCIRRSVLNAMWELLYWSVTTTSASMVSWVETTKENLNMYWPVQIYMVSSWE